MNKISTLVGTYALALALTLSLSTVKAQTPSLTFHSPVLVNGTAGQKNAEYRFKNVYTTPSGTMVNAFVKIKDIKNGAILRNIDDSTMGYYHAWQPVIGGPGIRGGSSHIEWEIRFKRNDGQDYEFSTFTISAIDVDGDNSRVREFVSSKDARSTTLPNLVPSLLSVSTEPDLEEGGFLTKGMGPVVNRTDIDTSSHDVRIAFNYTNEKKVKIIIGSYIELTGGGSPSLDRYNSLYFKEISTPSFAILPVKYTSFFAKAVNNSALLDWSTELEINHDHFEVERSFDQSNFRTVGYVLDGIKNAYGTNYSFKDNAADLKGKTVAYYRLKQVDIDGRAHYSEIKKVKFSDAQVNVNAYPNPFTEVVTVNFNADENGSAEIRVININGTIVKKSEFSVEKGNNTISADQLSKLGTGVYVLQTSVNGKIIDSRKLIKK